jgi:acrylyl-CoA reductase (NADPH)
MTNQKVLQVEKLPDGSIRRSICERPLSPLQDGFVRVRVAYSALNFKDALAATGNPGVAKHWPLVPGIDAVGEIVEGESRLSTGQSVMVAHPDFGTAVDGGFARFVDVPDTWLYQVPEGLSNLDAVTLGTAGFTAAQCVEGLVKAGISPDSGDIVVTGATGGVGIFAVMYLKQLGFSVVASTGKLIREAELKRLGAARVVHRDEIIDESTRPLLTAKWGGAVDTVGGKTLSSIIRSTKPHCVVTACGLVGGHELNLTVYPFILRGVSLIGIDSALVSAADRTALWNKMSKEWRLGDVESLANVIEIEGLETAIETILQGQVFGRYVIKLS